MRARTLVLIVIGLAASVGASSLAACSSFSGSDEGPADGASPIESGGLSTLDAGADIVVVDATPAVTKFCALHPDAGLCADFDEGDPVSFHFIDGIGAITVDDASFVSPPAAMKAVAADSKAFVKGQPKSQAFVTKQHLSYETYQGALGQDAGGSGLTANALLSSIIQSGPTGCAFDIQVFAEPSTTPKAIFDVTYSVDGGPLLYEGFALTAYPPPGQWAHVEMLLESGTDASGFVVATVKINTVTALDHVKTSCLLLTADPAVAIGLISNGSGGATTGEARFDNVLFEAQ